MNYNENQILNRNALKRQMLILTLCFCWNFTEQVEEISEVLMEFCIVTRSMMHCGLLSDLAEAVGEPGSYEGGGDWLRYIGCVKLHHYNIPEEGGPQLL